MSLPSQDLSSVEAYLMWEIELVSLFEADSVLSVPLFAIVCVTHLFRICLLEDVICYP